MNSTKIHGSLAYWIHEHQLHEDKCLVACDAEQFGR
jgi:hypothetical protein